MSRKTFIIFAAIASAAVAVLFTWRGVDREPRYNLVLVTLDTTRADRLGCYGYQQADTPNLDALAKSGVLFENAYTPVPLTLPSHATMLTGLNPPEHGLRINGQSRLEESIPTLTERLSRAGYRTAAFIASVVLDAKFGLDRGFDVYNVDLQYQLAPQDLHDVQRSADQVVDSALSWLKYDAQEPFFCWTHFYDPHKPYLPHPREFGDKYRDRPYDAEIAYVDLHLGRLLKELKARRLDERTLIVVVGDHGESLGEHREPSHGFMLYNSTLRVPFIVSGPGLCRDGLRIDAPVSLVDLFPTVADCLGIDPAAEVSGRSLSDALQGAALTAGECYGETDLPRLHEASWAPLRSLTNARWKYIRSTRSELYDLQVDPGELGNLFETESAQAVQMEALLSQMEQQMTSRAGAEVRLTPKEIRDLASLGYTGVGAPPPSSDDLARLRDIKDVVEFPTQLEEAVRLTEQRDFKEAEAILKRVVEAVPDYSRALGSLGICLADQKRHEEAIGYFERALAVNPTMHFVQVALGRAELELKRLSVAAKTLAAALKTDPDDAEAHYFLGRTLLQLERYDEARGQFETALRLNPELFQAAVGLGDVAAKQGEIREAIQHYDQALRINPRSVTAHHGLGLVWAADGKLAETVRVFSIVLEIQPDHLSTLTDFAMMLATNPQAEFRDGKKAIELATQACRISEYKRFGPLDALAAAYAEVGRFDDAVRIAEQAAQLPEVVSDRKLSDQIEERLALYRSGRPARSAQ